MFEKSMEIKFFKGITNKADLKKAYVKLLKQYHPDNGGDPEVCKAINVEYEYLFERLPKDGKPGQDKPEKPEDKEKELKWDKLIREMIDKIIHMDGIDIEIVGNWIWVDGDSYKWKEELKSYGFQWSKGRKKWHWTPYKTGFRKNRKKQDFDTLRDIFGSEKVDREKAGYYIAG